MPAAPWDPQMIAQALSVERLAPYVAACQGDRVVALRLYEWNLSVSGAFYEALGIVEVTLRNALHQRLTDRHGQRPGHWYDDPARLLLPPAHADITAARQRVAKLGRPETPGRVVAELNFGFWKFLLARRYEATLWTPTLRHAFPNLQPRRRTIAYDAMDRLHVLRNRIAHHEPVHHRDPATDVMVAYRLLDWIDADVHHWAQSLSRLRPILSAKPTLR